MVPEQMALPDFFLVVQTTNLFTLFAQQFPSHDALLRLVHFYLLMMVLRLRTAIWLIKSVIELCDMNNLLLFSRARRLLPSPIRFVFISFFASHLLSRAPYERCELCVAYARRSCRFSEPIFVLFYLFFFAAFCSENTHKSSTFETFKYASVRAVESSSSCMEMISSFLLPLDMIKATQKYSLSTRRSERGRR
jgi:hypothetical protein